MQRHAKTGKARKSAHNRIPSMLPLSRGDLVATSQLRPGVRRAGLPRLSGGADAGQAAPQAPRLIQERLNSAAGTKASQQASLWASRGWDVGHRRLWLRARSGHAARMGPSAEVT